MQTIAIAARIIVVQTDRFLSSHLKALMHIPRQNQEIACSLTLKTNPVILKSFSAGVTYVTGVSKHIPAMEHNKKIGMARRLNHQRTGEMAKIIISIRKNHNVGFAGESLITPNKRSIIEKIAVDSKIVFEVIGNPFLMFVKSQSGVHTKAPHTAPHSKYGIASDFIFPQNNRLPLFSDRPRSKKNPLTKKK